MSLLLTTDCSLPTIQYLPVESVGGERGGEDLQRAQKEDGSERSEGGGVMWQKDGGWCVKEERTKAWA